MAVPHMLQWTLLLENPYVTLPRSQKEKTNNEHRTSMLQVH